MFLSYVLLAFLSILSSASSLNLGFAVVAPGATTVQVSVGGSSYTLTAPISGLPYFNGSVTLSSSSVTYKYIVGGVSETFSRTFPASRTKTYNDFYGRQNTSQTLAQLGWPFQDKQQWTRALGPNGVYDEDYISTVFFSGSAATTFFATGKKSPDADGVTVAIISKDDIGYWTDGSLSGKHGDEAKIAMNVELSSPYHDRSIYKLRPSVFDPVFIREKIYNDILQAIGCPHEETSFTRVYVNGKGLGLYHLQEQTGSYDFIRTQFYGTVPEPEVLGTPLDCSTGADFSNDSDIYAFQPTSGGTNDNIVTLIDALANLDIRSDSAIAYFDANWFSIDHFFRAAIMEYLTGDYDSYWFFTTNFVMYDDPTEGAADTNKYYFIDQDFDQTFGIDLSPPYNDYGDNFTIIPYQVYVNKTWSLTDVDAPHRTMIDRLLSSQSLVNKFEATMKTIVKSVMNPIALGRRIDAVAARIRPELAWDRALGTDRVRQTTSTTDQWTITDFDNGFDSEVGGNWGLKQFISERANYIAGVYNFQFDNPPLVPPTSAVTTGVSSPVTTGSASRATTGAVPRSTTGATPRATTGATPRATTGASPRATTGSNSNSVMTTGHASQPATTGSAAHNPATTASNSPIVMTTGHASQPTATTGSVSRDTATTGSDGINVMTTGSAAHDAATTASAAHDAATTASAAHDAATTASAGRDVMTTGSSRRVSTTGSSPSSVTSASMSASAMTTAGVAAAANTTAISSSVTLSCSGFLIVAASLMLIVQ